MASKKGYKLLEEAREEGSNDSISNSDSSAEPTAEVTNDHRGFAASCPAILESSKDEARSFEGIGKRMYIPEVRLIHSWPPSTSQDASTSTREASVRPPSTTRVASTSTQEASVRPSTTRDASTSTREASVNSSCESNSLENERQSGPPEPIEEPRTTCSATSIVDCYNRCVRKIRNSWFIFIFQFVIAFMSASAVVMGIIFFWRCEGTFSSTHPALNIILGGSGLYLIYKWTGKVCRERGGEYYWNHERDKIIIYVAVVLFFLSLELMYYSQISPTTFTNVTLQSKEEVICPKTYYEYLYYMHFVDAGCIILAAVLYFADCCTYVCCWRQVAPTGRNGHFQPL